MSLYTDYLTEIETRKTAGLHPKPIDDGALVQELIAQIETSDSLHRADSCGFHLQHAARHHQRRRRQGALPATDHPGPVGGAGNHPAFAFELLSHMKGGPSVSVLLDLALGMTRTSPDRLPMC